MPRFLVVFSFLTLFPMFSFASESVEVIFEGHKVARALCWVSEAPRNAMGSVRFDVNGEIKIVRTISGKGIRYELYIKNNDGIYTFETSCMNLTL